MDDEATMPGAGGDAHPSEPTRSTEDAATGDDPRFGFARGDRIGRYKLIEVLGEGGFGVVWKAEQTEPVRRVVAIKLIKPGMDSKSVVSRFEAERQALAVMDHPNIARVLDGGATEAGYPYFVMELVKGEPITDFCDTQRLSINKRLDLFIEVCHAVQHAHMKGVIHRDLKPSNVLVAYDATGEPHPKVIDFGVAKALNQRLTEATLFTERGQIIGTPEYMSPEQAEMSGVDIDTRSDVYALGVMLYELLTGLRPFDLKQAALLEIQRVIREIEPSKPSTRLSALSSQPQGGRLPAEVSKGGRLPAAQATDITHITHARREDPRHLTGLLKRDLDWVVMKALEKDRTRRYDTATDLADELRRFLSSEPVQAGPPSVRYRLGKFVRKHRGPVVAGLVIVLLLVGGIIGTSSGLGWALRERDRANAATIAETQAKTRAQNLAVSESEARTLADQRATEAEAARKHAELEAYIANLSAADAALNANEFAGAHRRLDACPEYLRGWEWGWLHARSDSSLAVLGGHEKYVNSAAFSPDGTRVVTSSEDGTARVWDASTGQELAVLRGHEGSVNSAAFSPDGTRVVTASRDKTARVWDASTGRELAVLRGHENRVFSAVYSPDGTRVVTASRDRTARVWDAATGRGLTVLGGHEGWVISAAFSPDGTRVVTASDDKTARVWDASTGRELAVLRGHEDGVTSAVFSPDGTRVVTMSDDWTARVWDAATGRGLTVLRGPERDVFTAAFSPDGTRVVTASWDKTARVWDASTGRELTVLSGHKSQATSAAFSPDGTRVVTASDDNTARVWDASTGRELAVLRGHEDGVTSAVFSPDGTRVLTVSYESARVWDAATGREPAVLRGHEEYVNFAAFSPDGTRVVTASWDKTARVWDASTGRELAVLRGHEGWVFSAAFSPDGTRVVTASWDRTARVWDAATGRELAVLRGHEDQVTSAAFSPDGTRVVTASDDRTARVWDASTGGELTVLRGHEDLVFSAAFSPDGTRVVTASSDKTARVWDASTGGELTVLRGHEGSVRTAAFSPDGTRVVTASDDRTARVWDAATGQELTVLRGHEDQVFSAAFSPDGTRVVTASLDKTARVWDAATGRELAVLRGHEDQVFSAAFSPDGTRVVTASWDKTARVWDSVSYRERFPAIQRARRAQAQMAARVQAEMESGKAPEFIRTEGLSDPALTPEQRSALCAEVNSILEAQLEQAAANRDQADDLNSTAWNSVRFAPVNEEEAHRAVETARQAVALAPDDINILNTLGVALFRAGQFDEALATLTKSAAEHDASGSGPQPADWVFIAMAHWKLGHEADARSALDTVRTLSETERWKDNEEMVRWMEELHDLIPDQP